jgi:hypothetical protein
LAPSRQPLTVTRRAWPLRRGGSVEVVLAELSDVDSCGRGECVGPIDLRRGRHDGLGHRDPFDRMLAAISIHYNLPLVPADTVFDGIVRRVR